MIFISGEFIFKYKFYWDKMKEGVTFDYEGENYKIFFRALRREVSRSEKKQILFLQDIETKRNMIGEIEEDGELIFLDDETWTEKELKTIKDEILKVERITSCL